MLTSLGLAFLTVTCAASGGGSEKLSKEECDTLKPRDLVQAMDMLDACVSAETKEKYREGVEEPLSGFFGLEGWVRNAWIRGRGPRPLRDHLEALGFAHPDDMGSAIMDTWRRRMNGLPPRVDELAARSKAYWAEAEENDRREAALDVQEAAALKPLMMGVTVRGDAGPGLKLPKLPTTLQLKIYALQAWGGGTFVTASRRAHDLIYEKYTSLYWLGPDQIVRRVRLEANDDVRDVSVGRDVAWLRAWGADGTARLVALHAGRSSPVPLPPGKGWMQIGSDGERLVAVRPHEVFLLDGSEWMSLAKTEEELPWNGEPTVLAPGRLYFPGWKTSWLELGPNPKLRTLATDPEWAGGGRGHGFWETVRAVAVAADGTLWTNAARYVCCRWESLLRWNKDGYRVALYAGLPYFPGDLGARKPEAPGFVRPTGLAVEEDGSLLVASPQGIFRLRETSLVRICGFTNTTQWDPYAYHPKKGEPFAEAPDWKLEPRRVVRHGSGFLLGLDLGLLFVDPGHRTVRWLDAELGPDILLHELAALTEDG